MNNETSLAPVLIDGRWREARAQGTFAAHDPATGTRLQPEYPVSAWADLEEALDAAASAARQLSEMPETRGAEFLRDLAARIEASAESIVALAARETALAARPRLAEVELPRTTGQLRQAAEAAADGSWAMATIDTKLGLRSCFAPLGPVCVFGPNNFPLAFGSASGGDFAAAIAAGNPVIAKANTSHPGTTRLLAELAQQAGQACGLPLATVQLVYRTSHADGARLVADHRVGASAYTGSRTAGLELKAAADAAGKPIYLELSSINPVVILPGALAERGAAIAEELAASCLMGCGQFCTNPGLVLVVESPAARTLIATVAERFRAAPVGALLSDRVARSLDESVRALVASGAEILAGGAPVEGAFAKFANTLLVVAGRQFLSRPEELQREAFGNETLVVVAADEAELAKVLDALEGNLTGSIYSDTAGGDDAQYRAIEPRLRRRVGRLLNDKMPTGVAVSPAMNHGGPYPATGHPGFTAVGIPASLRRFAALHSYDNVRASRLPALLADKNLSPRTWRLVDGEWTTADLSR